MSAKQNTYIPLIYEKMKNQARITSIPREPSLSSDKFHSTYAERGYPVIYTLPGRSEPPEKYALLRTLAAEMGSKEINVRPADYADLEDYRGTSRRVKLSEYVSNLINLPSKEMGHAANNNLEDDEVAHLGIQSPTFYESSCYRPITLWISPKGAISPLHVDDRDNFVTQVVGAKRWLIYPVRDYPFLSRFGHKLDTLPNFHASTSDPRPADAQENPTSPMAKGIEFTLHAGEILYLPAVWAHLVETIDDSVAVNFWVRHLEPAVLRGDVWRRNSTTS